VSQCIFPGSGRITAKREITLRVTIGGGVASYITSALPTIHPELRNDLFNSVQRAHEPVHLESSRPLTFAAQSHWQDAGHTCPAHTRVDFLQPGFGYCLPNGKGSARNEDNDRKHGVGTQLWVRTLQVSTFVSRNISSTTSVTERTTGPMKSPMTPNASTPPSRAKKISSVCSLTRSLMT
jgi:hypothetical protein